MNTFAYQGPAAGRGVMKGGHITTFTAQAAEFAQSVERIVLVDGAKLTELMIEHGVGVSHRTVKVPKVDSDYFEE